VRIRERVALRGNPIELLLRCGVDAGVPVQTLLMLAGDGLEFPFLFLDLSTKLFLPSLLVHNFFTIVVGDAASHGIGPACAIGWLHGILVLLLLCDA